VQAADDTAKIVLTAGKVSVALDTQNGAITVQVGNRVTAYEPASLPQLGTAIATLEGIKAVSLPVDDISSRLPTGKILEQPAGVPFVPPGFDKPVIPATPPSPGQAPVRKHPAQNAAAFAADETLQHLDPTLIRNATVLRSIGPAAAAGAARRAYAWLAGNRGLQAQTRAPAEAVTGRKISKLRDRRRLYPRHAVEPSGAIVFVGGVLGLTVRPRPRAPRFPAHNRHTNRACARATRRPGRQHSIV